MRCKECGSIYLMSEDGSDYFCSKCQTKFEQRNEFKKVIQQINKINDMDSIERNFLNGFSYAEQEHISLVFKKFLKANHFPIEDKDFVNETAKKELKVIKETIIF